MAKAPANIRSLARAHTAKAVQVLGGIMSNENVPSAARVAAATALLDRGWGKPTQIVEATITRRAEQMSDDELLDIAAGSSEGSAEAEENPPVTH